MIEIYKYNNRGLTIDSLCIGKGIYYIKGVSGCGKTSLLKSIDNSVKYDGLIKREGVIVSYYVNEVIPLNCSLNDMKNIIDNIDGRNYYKLLLLLDMVDKESVKVGLLSKGEKQRAELIITLSSKGNIYLIDEPCSSLNDKHRKRVYSYLKKMGEKYCVVVVSHDDIEPSFRIENNVIKGECNIDKVEDVCIEKQRFKVGLLNKLCFSKLKTLFNIICLSFSLLVCYISLNIKRYMLGRYNNELIRNILIKINPVLSNIKVLAITLGLSSIVVYVCMFVFDLYMNKEKIRIWKRRIGNIRLYLWILFILEIVISLLLVFLFVLFLMK